MLSSCGKNNKKCVCVCLCVCLMCVCVSVCLYVHCVVVSFSVDRHFGVITSVALNKSVPSCGERLFQEGFFAPSNSPAARSFHLPTARFR